MVKNSNNGSSVGVAEKIQSNKPKTMAGKRKQYKGVRMRSWGSWVSEIRAPNQKTRIWLGSYATPEAAARAYDAALLCLKGSSADLNFPTTTSTHFTHTVMSPKSIQRTAAAAANSSIYPPSSSSSSFPSSPPSYDCRDVSTPCSGNYSATKTEEDLQSSTRPPSSPSDHQGDISMPYCGNHTASRIEDSCCSVDPWIDFEELQSPKCVDQVLNDCNSLFLDPPVMYECEDEGDIHLWDFC